MFVDAQLEFSDAQEITASAASTNIIDFNPAFDYNTVIDAGAGEPTFLVVIPGVTFTADDDATLAIELRSYASEDLSDTPNVIFTATKELSALVAGKPAVVVALPSAEYLRYLSLYYTVTSGPFTAGALDAFITKDAQTWRAYANNVEFADLNLSEDDDDSEADSVSFDTTTASVEAGSTTTVNVEVTGSSDVSVVSSDTAVATVSYSNGVITITGVAAGTSTITVTKGSATATISVTVTAA
ncbi:TPA: Ig-like domain-containing protein [Klebsiella pneumoniae]|uniref:Bbp16 family capsid cement protein n=1 Tax=Klebsiella pneumoniae TaxID=573 RepID=UPI00132F6B00|nr:Ig-like domain-containing protein [Klebsiella pneumoniae]HDZ1046044.1 Ig-like domain-containing protein [Klebsiella pneumoniae]